MATFVYVDAPESMPAKIRDRIAREANKMLDFPACILEGMWRDHQKLGGGSALSELYECIQEKIAEALEGTEYADDESIGVRFYTNGSEHEVKNLVPENYD